MARDAQPPHPARRSRADTLELSLGTLHADVVVKRA
jgi:hypothetical protein